MGRARKPWSSVQPRTPGERTRETWRLRPGALTSLLPPLLAVGPPRLPPFPSCHSTHLPSTRRRTSGARERCSTPPPGPSVEIITAPFPRLFLPWFSAATSVSLLPGRGRGQVRSVGVWRCCQPRGERLDKYSPRGRGRRQGLSTSTAFGVSPQVGRETLFVLLCVSCAYY